MDYLDFDLTMTKTDSLDYVVAARSAAGEAHGHFAFPFGELALDNRLKDLQIALLQSGGRRRRTLTQEEQAVQHFGRELFDLLFTGDVRSRYDVCQERAAQHEQGVRIRLRIDAPELTALPWEFLFDPRPGEYVCLSRNTPLVRYIELAQTIQPFHVTPPLRILGMVVSPQNLEPLDVTVEQQRMERALAALRAEGLVELEWLDGQTWRHLARAMRRGPWHIVHFVGHGSFDSQRAEGLVAFADPQGQAHFFSATDLARLLVDHRPLRLVLLNACEGARGGSTDIFASTAATLVRRGIPSVLAMQYAITDHAAIEFSETFYETLAEGLTVDAAVTEARKAISFAVRNSLEWGTPVLYLRGDGRLFALDEAKRERQSPTVAEEDGAEAAQVAAQEAALVAAQAIVPAEPARRTPATKLTVAALVRGLGEADPDQRCAALAKLARLEKVDEATAQRIFNLHETDASDDVRHASLNALLSLDRADLLDMILIPAGTSIMGADDKQHEIDLAAFYMDRTPVTNAQFRRFMEAGGYQNPAWWPVAIKARRWRDGAFLEPYNDNKPTTQPRFWTDKTWNGDDLPVVGVSWYEALAYAAWAGKRLPSEAEWEKAARGTDGRLYPWGNEWDPSRANTKEGGKGQTTPVGVYSPAGDSPYGVVDMAGNVWEWCSSRYANYPYNPHDGREELSGGDDAWRVLCGGSWYNDKGGASVARRDFDGPWFRYFVRGFRCCCAPSSLAVES